MKETEVLQSVLLNLSTFGTMDIPQLRYIEAVIKETLRLLPLEAQFSSFNVLILHKIGVFRMGSKPNRAINRSILG